LKRIAEAQTASYLKQGKFLKTMFQRTLYTAGPKPKISP